MYNYKKYGSDVLTSALTQFEYRNSQIPSDKMDEIWDITLRTNITNTRIKRVMGRYYPKKKLIEVFPHLAHDNLLSYKDTILHELAHHITNVLYKGQASHGRAWKMVCKSIGAIPSAKEQTIELNDKWHTCRNTEFYAKYKI